MEPYSWEQFDEDAEKIANWAQNKNFKSVYGIPRGGLILAVKFSHLLDIPLIRNENDITKDTLIVDDIVDTGGTVERLLASLGPGYRIATIFCNEEAKKPDFYIRKKTEWILFPWETKETSRYDGTI
ncbi:MAG: phosphoribosyltransferase [Candidatus Yanofskybacteria bacterium]|nr:phosphoribosyltransferase [Candidatus Yanofskybacteria bacterium]